MNRKDYENLLCERYEDDYAAGQDEGRQEGRQEGRIEGMVLAAKNMKAKGISADVIAEVTGLSEQEIAEL